jgi:formylglycine-generating enzyme required for sulfatase activity
MKPLRGGAWDISARYMRAAFRRQSVPGYRVAFLGFRVARDLLPVHMVLRGGAWFLGNGMARTASRLFSYRDYRRGMCGFRVVRAAEQRPGLESAILTLKGWEIPPDANRETLGRHP